MVLLISRVYLANGPSARTVRRRIAAATRQSIEAAMRNTTVQHVTAAVQNTCMSAPSMDSTDNAADVSHDTSMESLHSITGDTTGTPAGNSAYDSDSDGPLDSSDDDEDDSVTEEGRMTDLLKRLAQWKLQNNITNSAFNDLLKILRHEHPRLPKDSRTIVPPPKDVQYRRFDGGIYHHFGLVSGITNALQNDKDHVQDGDCIQLQLGIDGLPVHKSTRWHLWPILGRVESTPSGHVFAIGMFFGESKPEVCSSYLAEFAEEYTAIQRDGFQLFGCTVTLAITTVICDAQARAFVKCVLQYNGKHGCDKCSVVGVWDGRRTVFLTQDDAKRTDESFRRRLHTAHHQEDAMSPFETAGVGV